MGSLGKSHVLQKTGSARSPSPGVEKSSAMRTESPREFVLQLQRTLGNQGMQQMLRALIFQGPRGVKAGRDEALDQLIADPQGGNRNAVVQAQFRLQKETVATPSQSEAAEPAIQLEEAPDQRIPNRTGLPDDLKAGVEALSGFSMDDVRVHYNSPNPARLQALAYAEGTDIHVAPGQEKYLAHEAWHVVQQKQGRAEPTMQIAGVPVSDDPRLEHEADVMGSKALQRRQNESGLSNVSGHSAGCACALCSSVFHSLGSHVALQKKDEAGAAAVQGLTAADFHRLQRSRGNLAVQRLLQRLVASWKDPSGWPLTAGRAQTAIQRVKDYDELLEIKKRNEHEFIREFLGALSVAPFTFPQQKSGDGIMGKNCISASHKLTVGGQDLAFHVNFTIGVGTYTKPKEDDYGSVTVKLGKLHLTGRSVKNQVGIVEDGPSILSAARSIHCGPNNHWDWREPKAQELADEMGIPLGTLQAGVNAAFPAPYMGGIRDSLLAAITTKARNRLECTATFDNDSSWQ